MTVYVFEIDMTCGGCSGAIKRVLTKEAYTEEAIDCEWESRLLKITTDEDA